MTGRRFAILGVVGIDVGGAKTIPSTAGKTMKTIVTYTDFVPIFLLSSRAYLLVNSIRYAMLAIGTAILLGVGVAAYLMHMVGLIALCIPLAVMMTSDYVRRETLRDFSKYIGSHETAAVSSAGMMVGNDLRWQWDEVRYCAPEPGALHFELMTEAGETFHFVYGTNLRSDEQFEHLKQQVRRQLTEVKSEALDPS
jgi:hypothetical protein